jgi:hypothetical protein
LPPIDVSLTNRQPSAVNPNVSVTVSGSDPSTVKFFTPTLMVAILVTFAIDGVLNERVKGSFSPSSPVAAFTVVIRPVSVGMTSPFVVSLIET